jgi:hypothetical protein
MMYGLFVSDYWDRAYRWEGLTIIGVRKRVSRRQVAASNHSRAKGHWDTAAPALLSQSVRSLIPR